MAGQIETGDVGVFANNLNDFLSAKRSVIANVYARAVEAGLEDEKVTSFLFQPEVLLVYSLLNNAGMGGCGHDAACAFGAMNTMFFMSLMGNTLGLSDNGGCNPTSQSNGNGNDGYSISDPLGGWMNSVVDASQKIGDPSNLPIPIVTKE